MEQASLAEKPSLTLNRSYPVPPERVWRAWTDPEAIKRWWGPGGEDLVQGSRSAPQARLHLGVAEQHARARIARHDRFPRGWPRHGAGFHPRAVLRRDGP